MFSETDLALCVFMKVSSVFVTEGGTGLWEAEHL